jgi:NAD(P)-dependent dehydrogenase (short-subunit alcohol dehydrogenase family)
MAANKRRSTLKTKTERKNRPTAKPAPSAGRLSGRVAVVTGGNRGIGLAIARALVSEGCSVRITGRDLTALARAKEELDAISANLDPIPEIVAQRCEVQSPSSVAAVFAKVKKRWGRLDILINNAGISQAMFPVEKTSLELWQSVLDVNLTGLFLCARAAIPLMPRGGTIVNNLSVAAKQIFPNFSAYNASKHGALGFTLTLREELIPKGIRVTALMPGATDTEIWNQFWPDAPRKKMISAESVAQAVIYAVLLPQNANLSEMTVVPVEGAL